MYLILYMNGVAVDLPPFVSGVDFHYAAGKIGITAQDGWEYAQDILIEGEDGQPEVASVVHWSVAAMPEPDPEPLTPEQIRAAMPTLSPPQIRLLLISALGIEAEPDNDDLYDLLKQRIALVMDGIADPMMKASAKIYWETATFFERLNPLIDQIGALLGLTPEEIDIAWMAFVGGAA